MGYGSLRRALGCWIGGLIDGLHVYSDDLANGEHKYPCCVVEELDRRVAPLGCGLKDHVTRAPAGVAAVTRAGRTFVEKSSFRVTFTAPSTAASHGQELVDYLVDHLGNEILLQKLGGDYPMVLVDQEVSPVAAFPLESLIELGRQAIPPDITGEPFLYRHAITIQLTRHLAVQKDVTTVIVNIHFHEGTHG